MNYPIETNVPLPTTRSSFDWGAMESGNSIVVPRSEINAARGGAKAFLANPKNEREGWKVISRALNDAELQELGREGEKLNRIWLLDPTASD